MERGNSQPPAVYLTKLLNSFAHCFSKKATFHWFIIVVVGFMVRPDFLGVTSFIRALDLPPKSYLLILNFFHSQAWSLAGLLFHWQTLCFDEDTNIIVNSRHVLIGDHCYGGKEATRMPGVVTLRQNSETSTKQSWFRGHNWSFIALLQGIQEKVWAQPLIGTIDQGFEYLDGNAGDNSLTTRIVQRAIDIAHSMNQPCYLILDAYFAVGPAFKQASSTWALYLKEPWIHIITRAKKSVVAYEPFKQLPKAKRGKGRPRKLGKPRKLYKDYQDLKDDAFMTGTCWVYDKKETVLYQAKELYWKPINSTLLFIMAKTSRGFIVLMSSDTQIEPLKVIELYCCRITIEGFFSILKNFFGGLCYHFWSRFFEAQPRKPLKNKDAPNPVADSWNKIRIKKEAMERFVNLCAIAIGLCHLMTSRYNHQIWKENKLWLRTFSKNLPSVFMTKVFIAKMIEDNILKVNHTGIYKIIAGKKRKTQDAYNPTIIELPSEKVDKNTTTVTKMVARSTFHSLMHEPKRLAIIIAERILKLKNFVYHRL